MKGSRIAVLVLVALLSLLLAGVAGAQTSPMHDLSWHVLASGGREWMTSGSHMVNGTLGQFAIGPAQSAGHGLGAGYWYGIRPIGFNIYLPLVVRGYTP